jgi:hypothetical protein
MANFNVGEQADISFPDGTTRRVLVSRLVNPQTLVYECIDLADQVTKYVVGEAGMRKAK